LDGLLGDFFAGETFSSPSAFAFFAAFTGASCFSFSRAVLAFALSFFPLLAISGEALAFPLFLVCLGVVALDDGLGMFRNG
jgi:hypothetical protein